MVGRTLSPIGNLHAGVPQSTILSPLPFSLFMNDIVQATGTEVNLFADDTSVCASDSSVSRLQQKLQHAVDKLAAWFDSWALSVNNSKPAFMVFTTKRSMPSSALAINGQPISQVLNHKHLGLTFDPHLNWSAHTAPLLCKVSRKIGLLRRLRCRLPSLVIRALYMVAIRSSVEYATVAWSGIRSGDAQRLERLQRSATRLIVGLSVADRLPPALLLSPAGLEPLSLRRQAACAEFAFRLASGSCDQLPPHIAPALSSWQDRLPKSSSSLVLRSAKFGVQRLPRPRTKLFRRSPFYLSFFSA